MEIRNFIIKITKDRYSDKRQTEDRFDQMFEELKTLRIEHKQQWEEFQLKQDKKWEENKKEFDKVHEEIMANAKKVDRTIGALGARWGMQSEASFRNALTGILEKSFDVQVINVNEYDHEGEVFGHPDQVELDIIVKNGLLIICELKSSISKSEMYVFDRKVKFYGKRHGKKVNRRIVISPMVSPKAIPVAQKLNIEIFTDSIEVKAL